MIFETWLQYALVYAQQKYYKTEDDFDVEDLRSYFDCGFTPEAAFDDVMGEAGVDAT